MPKAIANNKDTTANLGFEAKLWAAADALRNNMDAAQCEYARAWRVIDRRSPASLAGFVLANGSMSSNQSGEGEIRKRVVDSGLERVAPTSTTTEHHL
jgi:type I restriction-modification system DNA methylase subunit